MKKVRFYFSRFGRFIPAYLKKRTVEGYSNESSFHILEQFCKYLRFECSDPKYISKQMIIGWFSKERLWAPSTTNNNVAIIRSFIKFLGTRGIRCWDFSNAAPLYKRRVEFIPHIFTENELRLMFDKLDSWPYSALSPYKHLALPLMFRFLINFGLRVSELCNIKIKDITTDILTVVDAKNKIKRFIPLNKKTINRIDQYINAVHKESTNHDYLFVFDKNKAIHDYYLETAFRELFINAVCRTVVKVKVRDFTILDIPM